ncbi:MAG TPA: DUF4136 domain-containing protein [Patescibacteria group bacterium]|nr:DUF4136 domain-containing protein [Patescibacteria group bacterium]
MISRSARISLVAVLFSCVLAIPASAQKVDVQFNHDVSFKPYKRYAWGKNNLVTRQRPEVEAAIEQHIEDSAEHDLASKGFVKDNEHPDFYIHYSAGGLPDTKENMPQAKFMIPGGSLATASIYGATLDVWMHVIGAIRFEIQDAKSNDTVWQATATKKIKDTKKFAQNLQKEIDNITKKALEKFPPKQ